jgi:NAD-dependent SIR2 family protein deacetylase
MKNEFIEKVKSADLVLVGVGLEFEKNRYVCEEQAISALQELATVLEGKNYFLISTCTNGIVNQIGFKEDRMVTPCGNLKLKQCQECKDSLTPLSEEDIIVLQETVHKGEIPSLTKCPVCGKPMVLNNVYAMNYDENGYLQDWTIYKKWLQGTINKNVCILELGVGLVFPSVIRWPFEKIAFYNQKAVFVRVNERLYHMSEELKDKGISVAQNAIDWLLEKDI